MAAAYDTFDYPAYWKDREYEHESEIIALKKFLQKIKKIDRVGDFGSGYGRLVPYYAYRTKRIVLVDSSASSLKIARNQFNQYSNIKYIHSKIENISGKLKANTFDLIILVRVIHHIKDFSEVFAESKRLLKSGGYLIVEFPNKLHGKSIAKNIFKGNLKYLKSATPLDKNKGSASHTSLPFYNYHPDTISSSLTSLGFEIVEKYSVSNLRSTAVKKSVPIGLLLLLEEYAQKLLSFINFGPSIFILSKLK